MKKLTPRYKKWLLYRHYRCLKIRKRKVLREIVLVKGADYRGQFKAPHPNRMPSVPEFMCFENNLGNTLKFINDLQHKMYHRNLKGTKGVDPNDYKGLNPNKEIKTFYDFAKIKDISPAVALVICAEYDRLKISRNFPVWFANYDKLDDKVEQTLRNFGFFEFFNLSVLNDKELGRSDIKFTKISDAGFTGYEGQGQVNLEKINKIIEQTINDLPKNQINPKIISQMYTAIGEAAENARVHAYPKKQKSSSIPIVRKWWVTGYSDRKTKTACFFVYDQGVTIPATLPNYKHFEEYLGYLGHKVRNFSPWMFDVASNKDGELIKASIEHRSSSTLKEYRGNGLGSMQLILDQLNRGKLTILSRKGKVILRSNEEPRVEVLSQQLNGTLFMWDIILD